MLKLERFFFQISAETQKWKYYVKNGKRHATKLFTTWQRIWLPQYIYSVLYGRKIQILIWSIKISVLMEAVWWSDRQMAGQKCAKQVKSPWGAAIYIVRRFRNLSTWVPWFLGHRNTRPSDIKQLESILDIDLRPCASL